MNTQLTDSQTYTSATGALDGFLNLEPLVDSIQKVLNDYQPAAYADRFRFADRWHDAGIFIS